jgi:hypothetical protein
MMSEQMGTGRDDEEPTNTVTVKRGRPVRLLFRLGPRRVRRGGRDAKLPKVVIQVGLKTYSEWLLLLLTACVAVVAFRTVVGINTLRGRR